MKGKGTNRVLGNSSIKIGRESQQRWGYLPSKTEKKKNFEKIVSTKPQWKNFTKETRHGFSLVKHSDSFGP